MNPVAPRRVAAFAADYLLMTAFIGVLTVMAFALAGGAPIIPLDTPADKLRAHALALGVVTAPIVIGAALFEASAMAGTPGKRALRLSVVALDGERPGLGRALVRNVGKFLPWEIAHTGIWHMPGRPFVDQPGPESLLAWTVALALAAVYVATGFIGSGRTPYDRLAGVQVVRREPGSAA